MELGQELIRNAAVESWRAMAGEYGIQGVRYEPLECGHNDVVMTVSPQLDKHLHDITVILNRRGIKMAKSDVQEHVFFLNWNTVPDAVVDFERMAGDTLCPECGNSVYKHPVDREHCDYNGMPFLHILCNGRRAKL